MRRLLSKELKQVREHLVLSQGHKCALCGGAIVDGDRVHLDHSHETGAVRGSLHGGCNMLLGKLERGLKRGIKDRAGFLAGLAVYLERHAVNQTGLLHPTWLTVEEKKARAKKRAKRRLSAR